MNTRDVSKRGMSLFVVQKKKNRDGRQLQKERQGKVCKAFTVPSLAPDESVK